MEKSLLLTSVFSLSNLLVLPFWCLMIMLPRWRVTQRLMNSPMVVLGPVLLYAALVLPNVANILPAIVQPSVAGVRVLLSNELGATAAWAHFLAFDLFVGRWIFLDAKQRGVSPWLVSPLLLLTLLLGPLGFLAYLVVRIPLGNNVVSAANRMRTASPALFYLGLGSFGLLLLTLLLQVIDARQLLGVNTWVKPSKFAISISITSLTLAWILSRMGTVTLGMRRAGVGMAAMLTIEIVVITAQAARGVPSHFNTTAVNIALFAVMGVAITLFLLMQGYVTTVAFLRTFDCLAVRWGIRLGLIISLFGGALGFVMTGPTPAQRESLQAGRAVTVVGAHSVGVPDGGPGVPVTGWSIAGGDLRVPHFVGLHALQLLPFFGWLVARRRPHTASLVAMAGASYMGVVVFSLLQALAGRPVQVSQGAVLAACAGGLVIFAALLPMGHPSGSLTRRKPRASREPSQQRDPSLDCTGRKRFWRRCLQVRSAQRRRSGRWARSFDSGRGWRSRTGRGACRSTRGSVASGRRGRGLRCGSDWPRPGRQLRRHWSDGMPRQANRGSPG